MGGDHTPKGQCRRGPVNSKSGARKAVTDMWGSCSVSTLLSCTSLKAHSPMQSAHLQVVLVLQLLQAAAWSSGTSDTPLLLAPSSSSKQLLQVCQSTCQWVLLCRGPNTHLEGWDVLYNIHIMLYSNIFVIYKVHYIK